MCSVWSYWLYGHISTYLCMNVASRYYIIYYFNILLRIVAVTYHHYHSTINISCFWPGLDTYYHYPELRMFQNCNLSDFSSLLINPNPKSRVTLRHDTFHNRIDTNFLEIQCRVLEALSRRLLARWIRVTWAEFPVLAQATNTSFYSGSVLHLGSGIIF